MWILDYLARLHHLDAGERARLAGRLGRGGSSSRCYFDMAGDVPQPAVPHGSPMFRHRLVQQLYTRIGHESEPEASGPVTEPN